MEHIRSNSPFNVLLLAEAAEDNTSILNSLCSYTVCWKHHTVKILMYTFQDLKVHKYICMEEPNIVDIFWLLPGAATFELMNMRINFFEVYNLLISAKAIRRVRTQILDRKRRGRLRRKRESVCNEFTYRDSERSLRILSESWKKRVTTCETKSGLLSSCNCCSCKNWLSKTPFYTKTRLSIIFYWSFHN